ncbi:MAG: NmrA family NAD(P)-binding protein [Bacteroidia bacterium]
MIFVATGAQGGGLARAILNDSNSEFAVRAVIRNSGSDKSKELAKMGAEVVQGDIDYLQSMKRVLEGAILPNLFFYTPEGIIFAETIVLYKFFELFRGNFKIIA